MTLFSARKMFFGAVLALSAVACGKHEEKPVEAQSVTVYKQVSRFAGSYYEGYADGPLEVAMFKGLGGLAVDAQGNVFVAEYFNHRIRKATPAGVVSTFAGTGVAGQANGTTATAQFDSPFGLAFDGYGNLYVCETQNHDIRKIKPDGTVTTLAGSGVAGFKDGPGAIAQFNSPSGIAADAQGIVYVADELNNSIRKVLPDGTVSTLAGDGQSGFADGTGSNARFFGPTGLVLDGKGNLYETEAGDVIRKITLSGVVSTVAGSGNYGSADGVGSQAEFKTPLGIAIDAHGDLFVSEQGNPLIRKVTPAGIVSTVAGRRNVYGYIDGPLSTAVVSPSGGIAIGPTGILYFGEFTYIRKVTAD